MNFRKYNLPSISALTAFEAVARRQSFARAAEELNTSQPAISRHIRNLEIRFGVSLFTRDSQSVRLTRQGEGLYTNVIQALDGLQGAIDDFSRSAEEVTLACSHAVSHLLLMPRYSTFRQALGPNFELRFLTAEYNLTRAAIDTGADIVFEYSTTPPEHEHVMVCREEIKPVGTPAIIDQAMNALSGKGPAPGLLSLEQKRHHWLTWADWQMIHPESFDWSVSEAHDNYVYLLEMAATGAGLALGWRSFISSYIDRGDLMEMPCDWYSQGTRLYARLTRFGVKNPAARQCLSLLGNMDTD